MSNRQGNCTSEASGILSIVNALIPKYHENPCDSMHGNHISLQYSYSLC